MNTADERRFPPYAVILTDLGAAVAGRALAETDGPEFFEKNVRPLLAQPCLACHSPASRAVTSALGLDSREGATKADSRGPATVSGEPEQSLLIRAVAKWTTGCGRNPPPSPKTRPAEGRARWGTEKALDYIDLSRRDAPSAVNGCRCDSLPHPCPKNGSVGRPITREIRRCI